MAWGLGVALVTWLIGVAILGRDWHGHQQTSGTWVDGVSLLRWATCWAALALVAFGTAPYLRGWSIRLLALLPLIGWIVWQLRGSALGPIPMVIYVLPTALIWCGALATGGWAHRRWRRLGEAPGTVKPS